MHFTIANTKAQVTIPPANIKLGTPYSGPEELCKLIKFRAFCGETGVGTVELDPLDELLVLELLLEEELVVVFVLNELLVFEVLVILTTLLATSTAISGFKTRSIMSVSVSTHAAITEKTSSKCAHTSAPP